MVSMSMSMVMVMLMFLLVLLLLLLLLCIFIVFVVSTGYTAFCFVDSTFLPREFCRKTQCQYRFCVGVRLGVRVCVFGIGGGCAFVFVCCVSTYFRCLLMPAINKWEHLSRKEKASSSSL